jgi:hypothetical protein
MARKKQKAKHKVLSFSYGRRKISVILDKVLIFRLMRKLHGRFWGVAGFLIMSLLLGV